MKNKTPIPDWEKKLQYLTEDSVAMTGEEAYKEIKDFIRSLLASQRRETIEEIRQNIDKIRSGGQITLDTAERQKKLTDYFIALKEKS